MSIKSLLLTVARVLVPIAVRRKVRRIDQVWALSSSLRKLRADPHRYSTESKESLKLLNRLVYGWANPDWSADARYLQACLSHALASSGTLIECGSGLSTLIVGAVVESQPSTRLVSLEHEPVWAERIEQTLLSHGITGVQVLCRPLKSYETYDWYDCDGVELHDTSLVICDGPPSVTRGGRIGCLPSLASWFVKDCIVLLDDCQREAEREIIDIWSRSFSMQIEFEGGVKQFAILKIRGSSAAGADITL